MPLVTVGIPTYNRAGLLNRAIASVLDQRGVDVQLVISDNASTDHTETLCRDWTARDTRIEYLRQPVNRGPIANFNAALAPARGEFFMWLSDDDWLDANYLEVCARILTGDSGVAMAAGRCLHYDGAATLLRTDASMNLRQPDVADRVRAYFGEVEYNSIFYAVMRTPLVRAVGMSNALANDWELVSWMLAHGHAVTTDDTHVHRTMGGTSVSVGNIVKVSGLPGYQARMPEITIARNSARAVARLPWPADRLAGRRRLARDVFWIVFLRRSWFKRFVPRPLRKKLVAHYVRGP